MAAKTATRIRATAANTINAAWPIPASATIQPERRNTITPKMLIKHEVNTPSQVPNKVLSETKKCESHHGGAIEP